jgi:MFS family permease
MVSIKYPDQVQAKISLLEAANGAGLFVGPIFGGLVYQFTHFCVPFFLFTAIAWILLPFMKRSMGEELDRDDNKDNDAPRLGYWQLLKHKRVAFAGMNQFMNIVVFTAGQPIFGPRLTNDYHLSNWLVGVVFAVPTIAYIVTGPILLPLITKKFEPRATMMIGFLILSLCCFVIGPSKILGFPKESVALMIIGLVILGMGAAFSVIPVIPEMLDAVDGLYLDFRSEVSDNFSGIFNVAGGFGQIIGPTVAGALDDKVGFNMTFDVVALSVLAYLAIYIVFCGGIGALGRSFKATILRFRKEDKEINSPTSPNRKLLDESDAEEPEITDDHEKRKALNHSEDSNNVSTDISFGEPKGNGLSINA